MSHQTQHAAFFLLTGEPGVGKTTLTKKLNSTLNSKGVNTSGFYTEEVKLNRVRQGFDVVTIDGKRGRLAREIALLAEPVNFKVGKYGVLVQEFENIALPSLQQRFEDELRGIKNMNFLPQEKLKNDTVHIIDEIGKMEFFSNPFKSAIREIFCAKSSSTVVATIPLRRSDALIESIRRDTRAKVWTVTKENRNTIHEDILKEMATLLKIV